MPVVFHTVIFWIYWGLAAIMGLTLVAALLKEKERPVQMVVAMLLVPVILRLLLIK